MKVLPKTQFGDPILQTRAKDVSTSFLKTTACKTLIKEMIYTMRRAGGVGIAAPQVGKNLRLAVMEMRPTPTRPHLERRGPVVVINPTILKLSKKTVSDWEGCLSLQGVRGLVPRAERVTVEYTNEQGERVTEHAEGFWARIFQHEIDHLDGVVYVERMQDMKTLMTVDEFKKRVVKKR